MKTIITEKLMILNNHFIRKGQLKNKVKVFVKMISDREVRLIIDTLEYFGEVYRQNPELRPKLRASHGTVHLGTEKAAMLVPAKDYNEEISFIDYFEVILGENLSGYEYLMLFVESTIFDWLELKYRHFIEDLDLFKLSLAILHEFVHIVEIELETPIFVGDEIEDFKIELEILNELPPEFKDYMLPENRRRRIDFLEEETLENEGSE